MQNMITDKKSVTIYQGKNKRFIIVPMDDIRQGTPIIELINEYENNPISFVISKYKISIRHLSEILNIRKKEITEEFTEENTYCPGHSGYSINNLLIKE